MASSEPERPPKAGDLARAWGCLIGLVGFVVALVGAFLPEGDAAGVLMWLGGAAFMVGLALVILGVLVRVVAPTRT